MRTLLFSIGILISLNLNAQINLVHTFASSNAERVEFSSAGEKYYSYGANATLNIYNLDFTTWQTINMPAPPIGYSNGGVLFDYGQSGPSDNLFNSDNLVEYINYYQHDTDPFKRKAIVHNELGNIILELDSTYSVFVRKFNDDSYKLFTVRTDGGAQIYSLPGTLPCQQCSGLKVSDVNAELNSFLSEPIPNPSNSQTTISYALPGNEKTGTIIFYDVQGRVVKTIAINNSIGSIMIQTEDLAVGSYVYKLQTNVGVSAGQKMIIIH